MKRLFLPAILLALIGCGSEVTRADTGLVMVCKDKTKAGVLLNASSTARCPTLAWVRPAPDSVAAGCTSTNCGSWTDPNAKWTVWGTAPATTRFVVCTADITPNVSFAAGVTANDPCPSANKPSPWPVKSSLQAALDPAALSVTLKWQPPTENEDGTPLTNLKGYYVFKSTGTDLLAGATTPPEGARLQEIPNAGQTSIELPIAPNTKTYFAVTAYACDAPCTTKAESKLSTVVDSTKAPPAIPTVALACTPAAGIRQATVTCTWSSTDATSCTASNGWTGTKPTQGTETLPPITQSAMYNLACTGPGGTSTASAPVIITSPPKAVSGVTIQ